MKKNQNVEDGSESRAAAKPSVIEKTPMFSAMNAARYQRQLIIRDIEHDIESGGSTLLCYVAGLGAAVDRADTLGFVDMLHNVQPGKPIDLLLHTPGGDVDERAGDGQPIGERCASSGTSR